MEANAPQSTVPGIEQAIEVGRGGFSKVFRAYQPSFDRVVALKLLGEMLADVEAEERFRHECRAMGVLADHPNIVTVHDAGVIESGQPYLIMAYMSGGSLRQLLDQHGHIDVATALRFGVRLAGALESTHRAGIIHRDIKPSNILLTSYGEPQLTDFGIAKVAGTQTTAKLVTTTIAYAAPEILEGGHHSPASDVYSLAATLFAAIAGRNPHEAPTTAGLLGSVLTKDPTDLGEFGIAQPVAAAISVGLARDPDNRPSSAAEFADLLRAAEIDVGTTPTEFIVLGDVKRPAPPATDDHVTGEIAVSVLEEISDGPLPSTRNSVVATTRLPRGRRTAVVAAVTALIAVSGLIWSMTRSNEPAEPPAVDTQTASSADFTDNPASPGTLVLNPSPESRGLFGSVSCERFTLVDCSGRLTGEQARRLLCPDGLRSPPSGSILAGVSLTGGQLRCSDFSGLDLTGTDFSFADIAGSDFTGAVLRNASFFDANARAIVVAGADFTGANLTDSEFDLVDFRTTTIDGTDLNNTSFLGVNAEGVDWTVTVFAHPTDPGRPNFGDGAIIRGANFAGLEIIGWSMVDATGANFKGAVFRGMSYGSVFDSADLTDVDAEGADFGASSFRNADLTGAQMARANLTGADLTGATVTDADFSGTVFGDAICPDGSNAASGFGVCRFD